MSAETFDQYRNVEVQGAIGKIILRSVPVPLEVAREIWGQGKGIPLDVVPDEFWRDGNLLRFDERMIEDF